MPLLTVKNLTVRYCSHPPTPPALQNISFQAEAGEAVGIIGESGAGKSTLALTILNLLGSRAQLDSGEIFYRGTSLLQLTAQEWQQIRGKEIALIPQASQNIWNPVLTIGHQIVEHIEHHLALTHTAAVRKAAAALEEVGFEKSVLGSYPHQLSGGMRQRAAIAASCVIEPACIIADECTNALDASHQNEVLDLLDGLRQKQKMTLLVISHDLSVIARLCPKMLVLYEGKVIEAGLTADLLRSPSHPYTQKLINATRCLCTSLTPV